MANKQTPDIAGNIEKHTNTPPSRGLFAAVLAIHLLAVLLIFQNAPARAQGVFVTPTPYPAISATAQAAQQRSDAAQADINKANQDLARAAEMKRNGEAQFDQAQADINAARAAQAAQNAAAMGEAIGRVETTVNQMRDTIAGQAGIITTLTNEKVVWAQEKISMTLELQQARTSAQIAHDSYTATAQRLEEAQKQGQSTPVVTYVFGALFVCVLAVLVIVVLQRKGQAAPVAISNDDDVVEGEFTNEQYQDSSG